MRWSKKRDRFLYEGNEIGKRMEVVGEEGIAVEGHDYPSQSRAL